MKKIFLILSICIIKNSLILSQTPSELFDRNTMEYRGNKSVQAKKLLRKVEICGNITEKEAKIDTNFLKILNAKLGFSKEQLKGYLQKNLLSEIDLGGSIDSTVSYIVLDGQKIYARYFVIHDVSSPTYKDEFPKNINDSTWNRNNPNTWNEKVAHVYLTRTGKTKTVTNFSEAWRATKFESKILGTISKGLFLHIEMVQPRLYPPGNEGNAPVAPTPGFTDLQYQKLALLYICASLRKREWLVPAFHANIDESIKDAHDDPQNFEIDKFTNQVIGLMKILNNL
jgi:hypothetical protein